MVSLGARHSEVKRLRSLLRDRKVRSVERAFVVEGPRVIAAALERGAKFQSVYLGLGAESGFAGLVSRLRDDGVPIAELKEGVLEKVGTTRTPQPVLAIAEQPTTSIDGLGPDGPVVLAAGVSDPGNLGTIIRGVEAAGGTGLVTCANSVDVYNPKVVRSSGGAIFAVTIVEAGEPVEVLERLGSRGPRLGLIPREGTRYDQVDLTRPCSLVVGNEAHGLSETPTGSLDESISIPMSGAAESLNVAMATSILLFEAARQRLSPVSR